MKKVLKVVLIIIGLIILIGGGSIFYFSRGLDSGSRLVVNEVNLLSLENGLYRGKYNDGRWSNEVEVEIKNHQIKEIEIIQDMTVSDSTVSKELFKRVIEKQRVKVDVVTGATVTSKAYLKSIELALRDKE